MKKIMLIVGTRPEAIKIAPVYFELKRRGVVGVVLCSTGQHGGLLESVFSEFKMYPDINLDIMKENQSPCDVLSRAIGEIGRVLKTGCVDLVLVQGDTASALSGAISAALNKIKVGHIEAGLRTWNRRSPFPEEINRVIISRIADFHFCPTTTSVENLKKEGITENVFLTGNTGIDALVWAKDRYSNDDVFISENNEQKKEYILVTQHRRENHGSNLAQICSAIKRFALKYRNINVVFPTHPNPNVKSVVYGVLGGIENVRLIHSVKYIPMVHLMVGCLFVVTDSGGIQEEAPFIGKPVIVTREDTERTESQSVFVGTDEDSIFKTMSRLVDDRDYFSMASVVQKKYGDGFSSNKIVDILDDLGGG